MSDTVTLGGKERKISMRFIAVREFKKLTGQNLAGGKLSFTELVRTEGSDFDPELFLAFLWSVLLDGAHPQKPDYTMDDLASWVECSDNKLMAQLFELWMTSMTGKSTEEIAAALADMSKNLPAPESGAGQSSASGGETLSASPTES